VIGDIIGEAERTHQIPCQASEDSIRTAMSIAGKLIP
jgi:hypothetical protein